MVIWVSLLTVVPSPLLLESLGAEAAGFRK